jgi:hypothetical protein
VTDWNWSLWIDIHNDQLRILVNVNFRASRKIDQIVVPALWTPNPSATEDGRVSAGLPNTPTHPVILVRHTVLPFELVIDLTE